MDERIFTILKEIALNIPHSDEFDYCCVFCRESMEHRVVCNHKPDCPTALARTILRELGIAVKLFEVSYFGMDSKGKRRTIYQEIGYDESHVRSTIDAKKVKNLQVSYIKDV